VSDQLAQNLERVRGAIRESAERAGRDPVAIQVIAVTKMVPPDRIREAVPLGLQAFGENRVQEALSKMDTLSDPRVRWHLIGHLQTNKVRFADRFAMVQSVDSVRLAASLEGHLRAPLEVLLEVNIGEEPQKTGAFPKDVPAVADALRGAQRLRWRGLMTVAPLLKDAEQARPMFRQLRHLRDGLQDQLGVELPELSMGMTDDFPVAVEEGATMLRLGRALFGARPS
jgi:pyridoxal phosphate enzyme (YggS family)